MSAPTSAAEGADLVRLERVTRRFGPTVAVDALELAIGRGEFVTLLGPSGCGKSTTLRMVGGFESPDEGRVSIDWHGRAVTGSVGARDGGDALPVAGRPVTAVIRPENVRVEAASDRPDPPGALRARVRERLYKGNRTQPDAPDPGARGERRRPDAARAGRRRLRAGRARGPGELGAGRARGASRRAAHSATIVRALNTMPSRSVRVSRTRS